MKRSNCLLFFSLAVLCLPFRMNAQKAALDSVLHLLEQHPGKDARRLDLLNEAVRRYEFIHPRRAVPLGDEAIELARSLSEERRLVVAIYRRAALDQSAGMLTDRGKELAEAIALGRELGLKIELAWALLRKGLNDALQKGPDTNRTEFADAARIFHGLGDDEGEGAALNLQAGDVRATDATRANSLYLQAERLLHKGGHTEWLVCTLQSQLAWHWMENRFDEAIACGERALALCSKTGYDLLIEGTHGVLGNANKEAGHYDVSIQHFLTALRMSEALDLTEASAVFCLNLGPINEILHDTAQAIAYLERGYELAKKGANPNLMTYALRGLGSIASERGDFAKALQHYEEALTLCSSGTIGLDQAGIDQCENQSYIAIGDAKKNLGDLLGAKAAYQAALDAVAQSQLEWEKALARRCLATTLLQIPDSLLHRAGFRLRRDCDLRAVELATQALEPSREGGWGILRKGALTDLAEGYERLGDPATALRYAKELMVVKDSLLDADKAKAVANLQIQYETEKKEQRIVLLGKDKEVQAKEIQKQKLVRNGFMGGFALVALFAGVFFFQRNRISKEKRRSEELLLNILPEEVAEELKAKGEADARQIDQVTVLFTDFKGFTAMSEQLTAKELVRDIHECFSAFDHIMHKHGIEKIKTIGDAYMAAGGLPTPNNTHALDVVKAAFEIRDFIDAGKAHKVSLGLPYFEIRIGIHTGPVVAGIVGVKKFAYDIWGDTVNIASRMESSGEVGQVNISEATYELVKNEPGLTFTPRGKVQAKGKGEMEMYFVQQV